MLDGIDEALSKLVAVPVLSFVAQYLIVMPYQPKLCDRQQA